MVVKVEGRCYDDPLMPDAQPPPSGPAPSEPLRLCPDCGGILEPTQPSWTTVVDVAAGVRQRTSEPPRWRCLICGYRD